MLVRGFVRFERNLFQGWIEVSTTVDYVCWGPVYYYRRWLNPYVNKSMDGKAYHSLLINGTGELVFFAG